MADSSLGRNGLLAGLLMAGALGASLSYGITEEIKFGQAEGSVVMERNGKPLPNARVILQPQFELPEKIKFRPSVRTNSEGRFRLAGLPKGDYEVQAYGKAHSLYGGVLKVEENKTAQVSYKAELTSAALSVQVSQRVLLPGEEVKYEVTGVSEKPDLTVEVYQLDLSRLSKFASQYDLVRSVAGTRQQRNPLTYPGLKLIDSHKSSLKTQDVEGYFAESKKLTDLKKGVYLMSVTEGSSQQFEWLTVTDLALVSKQAGQDTLVYATHLKTGEPLAGVGVNLHINGGTKAFGKTDANGITRFTRPAIQGNSNFVISGSLGDSQAHIWTGGWDEGDEGARSSVFIKTDRPIYRPGDEIQFKGTIRVKQGMSWQTPAGKPVTVTIKDPDEETVRQTTLPLNGFGSFAGSFKTDALGTPGVYRIETNFGGSEQSAYVEVTPFRKPEYTVSVTPVKKAFSRGEAIEMKLKAEYFTGEPLAGASVSVAVKRAWVWGGDPFDEYYDPLQSDWNSGDYMGDITARTDGNGEAILRFQPEVEDFREADVQDAKITFEASVADPSERYFSGQGSALVARGLIDVQAEASSWVGARDKANLIKIKIFDQEDRKPKAGQEFTASLRRVRWITQNREAAYEEVETVLSTQKGQTNPGGEAEVSFTPSQDGDYMVLVESTDRNGRRVAAEARFWVYGEGMSEPISDQDLKLVISKREYAPGEKVSGIIQVSKPGGSVLLSVEGQDIVKAQVVKMDSAVKPFNLGSLADTAPGARIKVVRVFEKSYQEDETGFKVSLKNKEVSLTIKPDKPETKPGETVTYTIRATDEKGEPVRAELSVGVVDEGIYAIREDGPGPLPYFYQPQWSEVSTSYSFPEVYLDGEDKAPKNMQIRKDFVDTAYWAPQIPTNSDGIAKVTVKMPDNLTEWRATVTAATSDSRFGQAKMGLVSRKDLMARLSVPSFMVMGDEQKLGAVISNTTDQEQKIQVKLDARGLSLDGAVQKEYSIPAQGSQRVDWTLKASQLGTGTLTLSAWGSDKLSDGLELKVPVRAKGVRTVASESGQVTGSWEKSLTLEPEGVDSRLRVRVDPHPFTVIASALPGMVDEPYGCVEQTLSRFVPALAVQQVGSLKGLVPDDVLAKIPDVAVKSLKRLKKMQHGDGGWGWWEYDSTSSLMTAAVLEGLYRSRQAGTGVDGTMIEKGLAWARNRLKGEPAIGWDENTNYLAYSVLLFGPNDSAASFVDRSTDKALKREKIKSAGTTIEASWPVDDILRLSLAQQLLAGRTGDSARSQKAKELLSLALERIQADTDTWGEIYWGETKGRLLMAFAAVQPDHPASDEMMRLILLDRQAFAWGGTRSTALVVMGANDLVQAKGLTSLTGSVVVKINGEEAGQLSVEPGRLSPLDVTLQGEKIKEGANSISVESQGITPYVQATLVQTVQEDVLAQKDGDGLSIERAYYRMTAKTKEDGSILREPEASPRTSFRSGEIFRSRMTVRSDKALNYLLIEDPIASHSAIVDSDDPYEFSDWSFWWDRSTYYSDKGVFFKRYLGAGTHSFEYSIRAESPGKGTSLPAMVTLFYQPKITARSSGISLEVTP